MSDFRPPAAGSDRVRDTLTELRVDADATALADAAHVRRRGQARTRHQAVAGLAAAVVLVVIGAGAIFGLGGTDKAQTQLPANPTPTPTPTAEAPLALAANPFLTTSDLTGLGRYSNHLLKNPNAPDLDPPPNLCSVRPTHWAASDLDAAGYHQDGTTVGVVEMVLRFDTASQAKAALDLPRADLAACASVDPAEGSLEVREPKIVTGVEGGVQMSRRFTPVLASEPSYYEVAAARVSNVVVVLQWGADDTPSNAPNAWAWSAEVLQSALDRAVG